MLIVYVLHCSTFQPLFQQAHWQRTPCRVAALGEAHLYQYDQSSTLLFTGQLHMLGTSVSHSLLKGKIFNKTFIDFEFLGCR